jgi:versiconal hemiacetal acetate reductase
MQNFYNLLYREEEREMIPYCQHAGLGIIPWSPIARGMLARPWNSQATSRAGSDRSIAALIKSQETESDRTIVRRVEEVAIMDFEERLLPDHGFKHEGENRRSRNNR